MYSDVFRKVHNEFVRNDYPEIFGEKLSRTGQRRKPCIPSAYGFCGRLLAQIEKRLDDSGLTKSELIREDEKTLRLCSKIELPYVLINTVYDMEELMKSYL